MLLGDLRAGDVGELCFEVMRSVWATSLTSKRGVLGRLATMPTAWDGWMR